MKHGSLFSGIGGFDLAAEWMGWENVFHCEIEPFCQKILKHYWPKSISYGDIKTTDFTIHRGGIDILTGGFPCQPFSQAGKRQGTDDNRYLWPEMLRAIREIQPGYIVGENVRGLTNWNGGLVFDQVQADLENEGYEVLPFLLPACAVNAPHRRDRIWFVANSINKGAMRSSTINEGSSKQERLSERNKVQRTEKPNNISVSSHSKRGSGKRQLQQEQEQGQGKFGGQDSTITPNSDKIGLSAQKQERELEGQRLSKYGERNDWTQFPTQSPICNGNDGLSLRLDGITFSKWRNESIKGAGNAIVPQVAYQIFQSIDNTKHSIK